VKNNKLFVAIIIVQSIASVVMAILIWSLILNPDSSFNQNIQNTIKGYSNSFKPLSGDKGDKGDQGVRGEQGNDGPQGDKGDTGDAGAGGSSIQGLQGEKGDKGDKGDTGEQGPPGPGAEWRCYTSGKWQYKYPADEDWTTTQGACVPL